MERKPSAPFFLQKFVNMIKLIYICGEIGNIIRNNTINLNIN